MPKKLGSEAYRGLATERGFEWLGPGSPSTVRTRTRWRCGAGHEWQAPYERFQQGSGGPHCWGRRRKTEAKADYRALAAERSFAWVGGSLPANTDAPTSWRCAAGHEWLARYSRIQAGHGCPHCTGHVRKTEADYRALAAGRRFEWIGPVLPHSLAAP